MRPPLEPRRLYTPAEAAAVLRVGTGALRRYATLGLVPATKTPGGHRRYAAEAVDAIAAGQAQP